MNQELILHGEAMIFKSSLPKSAKPIATTNNSYHIIADSETTGNHHVIDCNEGTEFFMDENGTVFMKNTKPTRVRCVHADRHSPIELEEGVYAFGLQQEFDHFEQNLRNVRD